MFSWPTGKELIYQKGMVILFTFPFYPVYLGKGPKKCLTIEDGGVSEIKPLLQTFIFLQIGCVPSNVPNY